MVIFKIILFSLLDKDQIVGNKAKRRVSKRG